MSALALTVHGYLVTHSDGTTCVFNSKIKNATEVAAYAASKQGVFEPLVKFSDAAQAVSEARGEYERMMISDE